MWLTHHPACGQKSPDSAAPLVSFITPLRNGEAFLQEMLASVLGQTYGGPLELCVFDDGSTDSSVEIVTSWEARTRSTSYSL